MARPRAHTESSTSSSRQRSRPRFARILVTTGLMVVMVVATGVFAFVPGENERASSLPAPLRSVPTFRRAAPVPFVAPPPSTIPQVAPPSSPPPAPTSSPPPPTAAPEPVVVEARPEPAPVEAAAVSVSGAAGQLVGLINGVRAGLGLAPYAVDSELMASAENWARSMASSARMSHQADLSVGVSAPWVRLGENVGVGGDVVTVHNAFVASPSHYENIADPSFGSVGVAVVESGGTLYIAEEFMQL